MTAGFKSETPAGFVGIRTLSTTVEGDVERARRLQDFALNERIGEEAEPLPVKRRKKDRRKDARLNQQPVH